MAMPTMGPEKEVPLRDRGERSGSKAVVGAPEDLKGYELGADELAQGPRS